MQSYIAKRGYVILKDSVSPEFLTKIRDDLNIRPYVNTDYSEPAEPFPVYLENKSKIYVPKVYGYENCGDPTMPTSLKDGDPIDLTFNGQLKEQQQVPVQKCIDAFKSKYGGGLLSLPCGFGKTAIALYLCAHLKVKTFVMVHKEFLLNQWIERIEQFLPNARIGRIQGKTIDIEDKDIVIGMIQSISMKNYPLDQFDSFGLVILDEAHRCPSQVFSRALMKINAQYMLALSATPERSDGLIKVLKWFVGDIIYMIKAKNYSTSLVKRYVLRTENKAYCEELVNFRGKVNMAGMINNITSYYYRTKFILKLVKDFLEEKRQILILSDRREHLQDIYKAVTEQEMGTIGYYVGGMKAQHLKESESKDVILGTFQMAQEGLDIKSIDTIIMASPKSNIEQAVGRIRPKENMINQPVIVDMVDDFSVFSSQAQKRLAFYKSKNYTVEGYQYDDRGEILKQLKTWTPEKEEKQVKSVGKRYGFKKVDSLNEESMFDENGKCKDIKGLSKMMDYPF